MIFDEGHDTEDNYPFIIKPNFLILGSIIGISIHRPVITYVPDDSIRDLSGYNKITIYGKSKASQNTVDMLSFDNFFLECNVARGMSFKGKRSGKFHNFTMNFDIGYIIVEKFRGGVQWYMMEPEDIISNNSFESKNENIQLVSFVSQCITFGFSIKEI